MAEKLTNTELARLKVLLERFIAWEDCSLWDWASLVDAKQTVGMVLRNRLEENENV